MRSNYVHDNDYFGIKLCVAHTSGLVNERLKFALYSKMAAVVDHKVDFSALWPIIPTRYLFGILLLGLSAGMLIIRRYHVSIAKQKMNATFPDYRPSIAPLEGFERQKNEPLQFRPFQGKGKYNLTMG